jgi:hypothetical protein
LTAAVAFLLVKIEFGPGGSVNCPEAMARKEWFLPMQPEDIPRAASPTVVLFSQEGGNKAWLRSWRWTAST